jgi:hypothetical protein
VKKLKRSFDGTFVSERILGCPVARNYANARSPRTRAEGWEPVRRVLSEEPDVDLLAVDPAVAYENPEPARVGVCVINFLSGPACDRRIVNADLVDRRACAARKGRHTPPTT